MMICSELSREAATELWDRRRARRSLLSFTTYTYPQYRPEPAHALIASHLDAVVRGEISRLMIFAPPQHGKSELASVRLPAFWLGQRPDDPVILASYGAALAENKSRAARQAVESEEYARLFPGVHTQDDSRAVGHWQIAGHRGGMLAAGVGGPITGHGAVLGVIDDPVENWEQAQSALLRDRVWEWYRAVFRPRIWEGGSIVLIMTRWHEDDLAGRLLRSQGSEWTVLRLPAIAETQDERDDNNTLLGLATGQPDPLGRLPGQAVCPLRFSLGALESLKRDVGSMAWGSEYQGCPRAEGGNIFKREYWRYFERPPRISYVVQAWDCAFKESESADYTVGTTWGVGEHGYYLLDMMRQKLQFPAMQVAVQLQAEAHRPNVLLVEDAASGQSLLQVLRSETRLPIVAVKADRSKEARAWGVVGLAQSGLVWLPAHAPWLTDFEREMAAFPNGAHDDVVDSAVYALAWLRKFGPGQLTADSDVRAGDAAVDLDSDRVGIGVYEPRPRELGFGTRAEPSVVRRGNDMSGYSPSRWAKIRARR